MTLLGNVIAPSVFLFPGLMPLGLELSIPATILAAFLERPFVTRAGVRENAIWYSIQANAFTLVLGFLCLPIVILAMDTGFILVWSIAAVTLSIHAETWYYRKILQMPYIVKKFIGIGNIVSSLILTMIPLIPTLLKMKWPLLPYQMEGQKGLLYFNVGGGLMLIVAAFCIPGIRTLFRSTPPPQTTIPPTIETGLEQKAGSEDS